MLSVQQKADVLRVLSMDMVEAAQSGHPGAPMGMADMATALQDHLVHNPLNPSWFNRDRLVLSNGHASALLYAFLHLTGYKLGLDDLRQFRQLHSKTPGHPEHEMTPGVETTTGPLGQGLANAVGMAWTEKHLAAQFNRDGYSVVDHYTYAFVGDGCLMEGISHEVCALAGVWQLSKLIVLYDDNGISIDGEVKPWFDTDVPKRFEAYGWSVIPAVDGHDCTAVSAAITQAKQLDGPTLICCKTVIGQGAPNKKGSGKVHGAPLGTDEIQAAREQMSWTAQPFDIDQCYYEAWDSRESGRVQENAWQACFEQYASSYPELAEQFERRIDGRLPDAWDELTSEWFEAAQLSPDKATRQSCQAWLTGAAQSLPELVGGSADLTSSNGTQWTGAESFSLENPAGRYIHYGVREFGMSAIMNGMALHGGVLPYAGTFLTFSDYARNAVRMAALMEQRVVFVYSHDSVALGEDGPTHQSIEHLASLRMIPGLDVWRPADALEVSVAWDQALRRYGPSCLCTTRQKVPNLKQHVSQIKDIAKGAYVLYQPEERIDGLVIATGSEVSLALEAAKRLATDGLSIRVVSMPCVSAFLRQPDAYQDQVIPPSVQARCVVEAGVRDTWMRFVTDTRSIIGVDRFGLSAPYSDIMEFFGLTVEHVEKVLLRIVKNNAQV